MKFNLCNRLRQNRFCATEPRCDLYYIFTVIDSYRQKKKTTREWEGMGVILPGVERDFPPVFSWDWDGKRLKFVMHFGNRR